MFDFLNNLIKQEPKKEISKKYQLSFNNRNMLTQELVYLTKPIPALIYDHGRETITQKDVIIKKGSILRIKEINYNDLRNDKLVKVSIVKSNDTFTFKYYYEDRDWWYSWDYYVNIDFLKEYALPCNENLNIQFGPLGEPPLIFTIGKLNFYKTKTIKIVKIFMILIDIFKNYEPEIVNQFAPSIYDTLFNFNKLMNSQYTDTDMVIDETCRYMEDVYNTIISFGENTKYFPTPCDIIEAKEEAERKALEERNERIRKERESNQKLQNEFLEKMKYRRELLANFNEPLVNIQQKIEAKNAEIDNSWKK